MKGKEVWIVVIREKDSMFEQEYYVFAHSVAQAEKRGIEVCKELDGSEKVYCHSASFVGNVY